MTGTDKEQENQEYNVRQGSDPLDLMLAREIRNLDREIQPARDLWPGIERNISELPQRKKTELLGNWMPYAIAASLVIAVSSLLVNLVDFRQPGTRLVTADYAIDSVEKRWICVPNLGDFTQFAISLFKNSNQTFFDHGFGYPKKVRLFASVVINGSFFRAVQKL